MKNVVFFGTPKIGADILKTLLECDVNIVGVVCQPDKQANRGKISYSEVKTLALQNNLKLFQPNKLNEILNELTNLNIDLIVTCAYGLIVPESILNLPKYKCVNIHTSLLPKYRGAAPIQYALLNNDSTTGVTLMYMDKGMDTGDIIKQASVSIDKDETYKSLYNKLSDAGSTLIKNEINNLFSDNVIVKKQNNELATYTQKITREVEHID
jgi:methionyl-tRNA formyltransferase